jgi:hypothetical protein
MFLLIAYTRYVRALDVAAQAQATLARRLAERERELAASHARLRQVEREQTLMAERQRLMREMHDGVGSSLMSALRWVEQGRPGEVDVAQVLRESIDDLKISIDSLEPVDADLLALLAGLRWLAPRLRAPAWCCTGRCRRCRPCPGWTRKRAARAAHRAGGAGQHRQAQRRAGHHAAHGAGRARRRARRAGAGAGRRPPLCRPRPARASPAAGPGQRAGARAGPGRARGLGAAARRRHGVHAVAALAGAGRAGRRQRL